jgi:hypothetical protein
MIDQAVIDELVALRSSARLAAETYTDAIAAQSETHDIRKGALRRYINAREKDQLGDLDLEASDLAKLMETK